MALGSLTVPRLAATRSGIFILHLFKERPGTKSARLVKEVSPFLLHCKGTAFSPFLQIFQRFSFKKQLCFRQTLQTHKNKDTKRIYSPIFAQKRQNVHIANF